jgi:hypothetical protein
MITSLTLKTTTQLTHKKMQKAEWIIMLWMTTKRMMRMTRRCSTRKKRSRGIRTCSKNSMIRSSMKRLCRMTTKMTSRIKMTCEILYMAIIIIINKDDEIFK